jgi:hypothetical protein
MLAFANVYSRDDGRGDNADLGEFRNRPDNSPALNGQGYSDKRQGRQASQETNQNRNINNLRFEPGIMKKSDFMI